jgi:hypothetical protein
VEVRGGYKIASMAGVEIVEEEEMAGVEIVEEEEMAGVEIVEEEEIVVALTKAWLVACASAQS